MMRVAIAALLCVGCAQRTAIPTAPAAAWLEGEISGEDGEVPFEGAAIEVRRHGQDAIVANTRSGADGRWQIGLEPGEYDVEVRAPGYGIRATTNVLLLRGARYRFHGLMSWAHSPCDELRGRVIDALGAPVPRAELALWIQDQHDGQSWGRFHADEDGRFWIDPPNLGHPVVAARHGGEFGVFRPTCRATKQGEPKRDSICEGDVVLGEPPPEGLDGATVFRWTEPPTYLVAGGRTVRGRVVGKAGVPDSFVLAFHPVSAAAEPVRAQASLHVNGKCVDCASPQPRWQVFHFAGDEFELRGVPKEPIELAVTTSDWRHVELLVDAQQETLDVRAEGTASLRARLLDREGRPAPGEACLTWLQCVPLDANGRVHLEGLSLGGRILRFRSAGGVTRVSVMLNDRALSDLGDVAEGEHRGLKPQRH